MLLRDILYAKSASKVLRVVFPLGSLLLLICMVLVSDRLAYEHGSSWVYVGYLTCLLLFMAGIMINIPGYFGVVLTRQALYVSEYGRQMEIPWKVIAGITESNTNGHVTIQVEYLSGDGSRKRVKNIYWLSDMEALSAEMNKIWESSLADDGIQVDRTEVRTTFLFWG